MELTLTPPVYMPYLRKVILEFKTFEFKRHIDKLKSFKLINTPIMIPIMMFLSEDDVKA